MSSDALARISALKILVGALAIVPLRFSAFAGAVAIPFVLHVGFTTIWFAQPALDFYYRWPWLMVPIVQLIKLTLYTLVAVAVHKVILLGPASVPRYRLEWGVHTTRFLVFAILFYAAGYALSFVGLRLGQGSALAAVLVSALAWGVVIFVGARLLLVFPAAAVGRPISLKDSWRLTRHRKFLMLLIAIVYPAVIDVPLSWIPSSTLLGYTARSVVSMLTLIVTVILLSFAYQQIQKENELAGTMGTHGT